MTNKNKTIIGVASIAVVTGILLYVASKNRRVKKERVAYEVADEGYEFAHDVLYPLKGRRMKGYHGGNLPKTY